MYTNFISEFIRAKWKEGSGSTVRLHAKVGNRMPLLVSSNLPLGFTPMVEIVAEFLFMFQQVEAKKIYKEF